MPRNIHPVLRAIARAVLFLPRELREIIEAVVRHWPGKLGFTMRRLYYRIRLKHVGRNVLISPGVRFFGHRYISIGDDTHVDLDCILVAGHTSLEHLDEVRRVENPYFTLSEGELSIGKGVHIAPGCLINGIGGVQIGDYCGCTAGTRIFSITNHYAGVRDRSRRDILFTNQAMPRSIIIGPVVLERNVGIALNSVVLPGTALREDSFVGIGSVARGVIPPNTIVAGNPAVRIKDRFTVTEDKQKPCAEN
ncbi:MAG: acyltransferase [Phycisphaerae bacterium]|nr:acyltransferase [Phycisphaerae bacterium]